MSEFTEISLDDWDKAYELNKPQVREGLPYPVKGVNSLFRFEVAEIARRYKLKGKDLTRLKLAKELGKKYPKLDDTTQQRVNILSWGIIEARDEEGLVFTLNIDRKITKCKIGKFIAYVVFNDSKYDASVSVSGIKWDYEIG